LVSATVADHYRLAKTWTESKAETWIYGFTRPQSGSGSRFIQEDEQSRWLRRPFLTHPGLHTDFHLAGHFWQGYTLSYGATLTFTLTKHGENVNM
jgi:hypothetical protein